MTSHSYIKTQSLTRRLVIAVLLVELVSSLCVTASAYFYEQRSHFRSFDIMIRGRADTVLGAVQDAEDNADSLMLDTPELDLPSEDIYEVRDESGHVLGHSPNWNAGADNAIAAALNFDGYRNIKIGRQHYRVLRSQGLRIVDAADPGGGVPRRVTLVYGAPTFRVWNAVWGAVRFFALANLLVLVITAIAMIWLLNRGMAPIRQLAVAASQVSVRDWTFKSPPEARRTTELAPLVITLDSLLYRLELSFEEQQTFLGDAAHELKTAVSVLKSSLQLLALKDRSITEYRAGLEHCERDCARIEEVVARMLLLARIEQAELAPNPIGNLAAAVLSALGQLGPFARLHNIQTTFYGPQEANVNIAQESCELLCNNLLLNALQHSPSGSSVEIHISPMSTGTFKFEVIDHGDGIPPEAISHVFERFYRGDPSRARSTGGTGLGLAICKAIVERANGSLRVTQSSPRGTTLEAILPSALPE